jgi:Mlc titration factor MtfA (ptsG expression regulator)
VVVLSWDDVMAAGRDVHHAHNVVLHEFAHQLDAENGAVDGAPLLEKRGMYAAWARILSGEFASLQRAAARGVHTDIDPYGATNPAEFFAVITEAFFEAPLGLRSKHPALYEELALFYKQDPARFGTGAVEPGAGDR